jgi:hypothetical protein
LGPNTTGTLTLATTTAPLAVSQRRRYGPPDPVTALMLAGRKVAWDWTRSQYTLDGDTATPDQLATAAAQLPPPPRGWAIDPRAITGPCPGCDGPTAGGLCLKCRVAAALTSTRSAP